MATVEIPLTKGKVALIDECDLSLVEGFSWHASKTPDQSTWYARSGARKPGTQTKYMMHRLLLSVESPRILVDHRDGNGLNNTRGNLRIATDVQNCRNQAKAKGISQFKGVYPVKRKTTIRWASRIKVGSKRLSLGVFDNESDAASAYDRAAIEHFGEFARLNFPLHGESCAFAAHVAPRVFARGA